MNSKSNQINKIELISDSLIEGRLEWREKTALNKMRLKTRPNFALSSSALHCFWYSFSLSGFALKQTSGSLISGSNPQVKTIIRNKQNGWIDQSGNWMKCANQSEISFKFISVNELKFNWRMIAALNSLVAVCWLIN